jgi:hypothetical protein
MSLWRTRRAAVSEEAGKRHCVRATCTHVSACRGGGGSLARDARSLAAEGSAGASAASGEGTGAAALAAGLLSAAARLVRCRPAATVYERGAGATCAASRARAAASRPEASPAAPSSCAGCTPGAVAQHAAAAAHASASGSKTQAPWQRRQATAAPRCSATQGRRTKRAAAVHAGRSLHAALLRRQRRRRRGHAAAVKPRARRRVSTQRAALCLLQPGSARQRGAGQPRRYMLRARTGVAVRTATAGSAAPLRASPCAACPRPRASYRAARRAPRGPARRAARQVTR